NDGSAASSKVTTTIGALADVVVTKSGVTTVNASSNLTYTLNVSNQGPAAATSVVVRDTLPGSVIFVSASNGGTPSSGVVTWPTIASLANGASASYTVTVIAPPTGTIVNVAAATSSTADPVAGNNNGSDP